MSKVDRITYSPYDNLLQPDIVSNDELVQQANLGLNRAINSAYTKATIGNYAAPALGLAATGFGMLEDIDMANQKENAGNQELSEFVTGNDWNNVFNADNKLNSGLNIVDSKLQDFSGLSDNTLLNTNVNNVDRVQSTSSNGWGVLGDAAIGASMGLMFGPVGAVVGGGIGALSGIARTAISDKQNQRIADALNAEADYVEAQNYGSRSNAIKNNKQKMIRNNFLHTWAEGGPLEGLNGVTKFNYEVGREYEVDENTYNKLIKMGYGIEVIG